jgi:predicted HTH transcriptional regulator
MARLVMNMIQWEYNLIPVKVLKEQKAEYIQSLIDTREQENENIFVDAMLRIHQQNLSSEIAAFKASMVMDVLPNDTKDDTKQLTERQRLMLDLIRKDDTITIAQMIQKAQVSEITIKRELAVLKQLGIIQREGGRKEGRWKILNHDL